jgi:hypothetical protein
MLRRNIHVHQNETFAFLSRHDFYSSYSICAYCRFLILRVFNDMTGTSKGKGVPAFWESSNQRNELIAGVKFMTQADPDLFNDSDFLRKTDIQLNALQAGIVVAKNNLMTFASPFVDSPDLFSQLLSL